jgi:NAD+ kinase
MRVAVMTHRGGRDTGDALHVLLEVARERQVTLIFDETETVKHGLTGGPGIEVCAEPPLDADLCVVLGGDGTILTALRRFAGTQVPVFAVNFGEIGFLATMDPDQVRDGFERAFALDFETMALPSITLGRPDQNWVAFNDISLHRLPGKRVANLAYALGGEEIGRVRCDGIVVSTPAGSTGYNLANGGPVLAWGVEGYVVSFIAPHSFTARALVAAPSDMLTVNNASREDAVEIHVDGRPACQLPAGQDLTVDFGDPYALLAQLPGASFYHRLRERFGRLAR